MHKVYIQIGSNLGSREEYLENAKNCIGREIGRIAALSEVFESEPWGFFTSNWFLNQVLLVETELDPQGLLHKILSIEQVLGRRRDGRSYTSRTIDLDILLFDGLVVNTPELKIPHSQMHERRFVLLPLAQIAPNEIHPTLGKSMYQLLEECSDELEVRPHPRASLPAAKGWCRI